MAPVLGLLDARLDLAPPRLGVTPPWNDGLMEWGDGMAVGEQPPVERSELLRRMDGYERAVEIDRRIEVLEEEVRELRCLAERLSARQGA